MKLLSSLMSKCYKYDLDFYLMNSVGFHSKTIRITTTFEDERILISERIIRANWLEEPTDEVLKSIDYDIEIYLNRISHDTEHSTEHAQARLTEQERKMKESGHKESDFS